MTHGATPSREEVAQLLWDTSDGQFLGIPWGPSVGPATERYRRMANAVRARYAPRCCPDHGRVCEPPSELCCHHCTEAGHQSGDALRGEHTDGTVCVNPDLSPNRYPTLDYFPYALVPVSDEIRST